jgi:hypothetical protein
VDVVEPFDAGESADRSPLTAQVAGAASHVTGVVKRIRGVASGSSGSSTQLDRGASTRIFTAPVDRDRDLEQYGGSRGNGSLDHSGETTIRNWPTRSGCFARVRTGRLVEVRIGRMGGVADIESLNSAVFAAVHSVGPGAVLCADHRYASPLPGDLADVWSGAMRRTNRKLIRSVILVDPANTTFNLQIARIVKCAGSDLRRVVADRDEAYEWLDVGLTDVERAALRVFLAGPG